MQRIRLMGVCTWLAVASVLPAADVVVQVDAPASTGAVVLLLFDSADAFGDLREPVVRRRELLDGRSEYRLDDVPPGEYALLVYYDENANDRLDRNFIGIPREPLAFSNGYRPKGPPSYSRAAFELTPDEDRLFALKLARPLGPRGRIGLGIGVIAQSSPYRGSKEAVMRFIPAITYTGERLQIFGPRIQYGLAGSGNIRLAAIGTYRLGAYEADDSPVLKGLDDRDDTFMLGLALQIEAGRGIDLSAQYQHDALDRIGGSAARLAVDKSFRFGSWSLSPGIGLGWRNAKMADHDFGVPPASATDHRPAYGLGAALSVELTMGALVELSPDWLMAARLGVEFFEDEVADSPIVGDRHVLSGFATLTRLF